MKTTKLKSIENIDDFESRVEEMMNDFLFSMVGEQGLTREPNEEDFDAFGHNEIGWMYTQRSMKLYHDMCRRITRVAEQHFPNQAFEIRTCYMMEP